MEPIEPAAPQLRSRSLSFRRRGPKGELSRVSKRDSKRGGSLNPSPCSPSPSPSPSLTGSGSPSPSPGGSSPEARAARSARWGAGPTPSPVGARLSSIQSRLSSLSPLSSPKAALQGAEWAGTKGWSRESHDKASVPQEDDEDDEESDQPPPSTITRQPSLLPLLGSTLAALDQLPDEVLMEIMISVEVQ